MSPEETTPPRPRLDEVQSMFEELERDGLLEKTGDYRDGHPVYRATEAGQAQGRRERWDGIEDREVLTLFGLALAANGSGLRGGGEVALERPQEVVAALVDELGEVVLDRGLAEAVEVSG